MRAECTPPCGQNINCLILFTTVWSRVFFILMMEKKFKERTQVKLELKLSIDSFITYFRKREFLRQWEMFQDMFLNQCLHLPTVFL